MQASARLRSSQHSMPLFGLGTSLSKEGDCHNACISAFKHGYRHIDTAAMYENEDRVGEAVRQSGIPREEIFVTTKLLPEHHGAENAANALRASLDKLGLDYVDLYLIHSPQTGKIVETWKALLELKKQGLTKAVGVSNFGVQQLAGLKATGLEMPDVNQIELHIWNHQKETVKYCEEEGIVVEGYCPLARGKRFGQTKVKDIAEKLGKTEAEVALRWSVQKGFVTIPKSTNENRLVSNLSVLEWEIPEAVMAELEDLDEGFQASMAVKAMTVPWNEVSGL